MIYAIHHHHLAQSPHIGGTGILIILAVAAAVIGGFWNRGNRPK